MKLFPGLAALTITLTVLATPGRVRADSIFLEDFSSYNPEAPWVVPGDTWTHAIGSSWSIVEGEGGTPQLQSSPETKKPLAASGQVHFALKSLDRTATRFALKMAIPEGATISAGQNATLIIGFAQSLDPQNEALIVFDPKADSVGTLELGVVPIRILARTAEPGKPGSSQIVTEMFDLAIPFTLEIEVDAEAPSVRARVNGESWSEPVPLPVPWEKIQYLRFFQRSLRVNVQQVDFLD